MEMSATVSAISRSLSSRVLLSSNAFFSALTRLASLSCRNLLKRIRDSWSSMSLRLRISSLSLKFFSCKMTRERHAAIVLHAAAKARKVQQGTGWRPPQLRLLSCFWDCSQQCLPFCSNCSALSGTHFMRMRRAVHSRIAQVWMHPHFGREPAYVSLSWQMQPSAAPVPPALRMSAFSSPRAWLLEKRSAGQNQAPPCELT